LPDGRLTVHLRKLHLHIVVSPRAFARHLLSPLEISQVEDKGYTFTPIATLARCPNPPA
jgi:hypothetical protein